MFPCSGLAVPYLDYYQSTGILFYPFPEHMQKSCSSFLSEIITKARVHDVNNRITGQPYIGQYIWEGRIHAKHREHAYVHRILFIEECCIIYRIGIDGISGISNRPHQEADRLTADNELAAITRDHRVEHHQWDHRLSLIFD